uniref:GTP-binding protein Sar1 n=1 Tax=Lygus hesperus TaxID=30085 RepID=A0A0A9WZX4_LYGHE
MIDARDEQRFEESRTVLCETLTQTLDQVPIILLINKLDLIRKSLESVCQSFIIPEHLRKQREIIYFGIVATNGDGVDRVLLWIRDAILTSRIVPSREGSSRDDVDDSFSSLPV